MKKCNTHSSVEEDCSESRHTSKDKDDYEIRTELQSEKKNKGKDSRGTGMHRRHNYLCFCNRARNRESRVKKGTGRMNHTTPHHNDNGNDTRQQQRQ